MNVPVDTAAVAAHPKAARGLGSINDKIDNATAG
jgi:hypothetical protein